VTATVCEIPGALIWRAKSSFQRYVATLPDGVCELSSDIDFLGTGTFAFPLGEVDADTNELRFRGAVTFRGHADLLMVPIANPSLQWVRDRWELSCGADLTASDRFVLAISRRAEQVAPGILRFRPILAPDGVFLFGGTYPAGEPLDDLVVQLESTAGLPDGSVEIPRVGSSCGAP